LEIQKPPIFLTATDAGFSLWGRQKPERAGKISAAATSYRRTLKCDHNYVHRHSQDEKRPPDPALAG
jgi:hypothetical protein